MRGWSGPGPAVSAGPVWPGAERVPPAVVRRGAAVSGRDLPQGAGAGLQHEGSTGRGERLQMRVWSGKGTQPWGASIAGGSGVDRETVRIPGFTAGIAHCDLPQEAAK